MLETKRFTTWSLSLCFNFRGIPYQRVRHTHTIMSPGYDQIWCSVQMDEGLGTKLPSVVHLTVASKVCWWDETILKHLNVIRKLIVVGAVVVVVYGQDPNLDWPRSQPPLSPLFSSSDRFILRISIIFWKCCVAYHPTYVAAESTALLIIYTEQPTVIGGQAWFLWLALVV